MLRPTLSLIGPLAVLALATDVAPHLSGSENQVSIRAEALGLAPITTKTLQAFIDAGDWRSAEDTLFKAAEGSPQNATLLRALGIAHYQAGRYFSAASALKRSDALDSLDPEARFLLAGSLIRVERSHWARAELERLVAQHEDSDRYGLVLAQVRYDQGQFLAAVSALDQVIARTPESAAANDLLGQCLEGLGRYEAAVAAFERAISLAQEAREESAWPYYHLGSLLHDLGDLDIAEAALASAVAVDPDHAPARRELGVVYMKTNKLHLALRRTH